MSHGIKPRYPWWEFLVPGVLLLLGSVYIWWYLTELEGQPGVHQIRMPSAAVYLYQWGGKWGVVLFVTGVGGLFSGIGTYKLIGKLRERRRQAEVRP
jgi:hypothetical protein